MMANSVVLKRCEVCGAVVPSEREKYCSQECYRKGHIQLILRNIEKSPSKHRQNGLNFYHRNKTKLDAEAKNRMRVLRLQVKENKRLQLLRFNSHLVGTVSVKKQKPRLSRIDRRVKLPAGMGFAFGVSPIIAKMLKTEGSA
jgi:hypothetical protein